MNTRQLYSVQPSESEFADRCIAIAELEAQVIDYVLSEYGLSAQVNPQMSLITQQFFGFALDLIPGKVKAKVKDVFALHSELALAISNLRGVKTHLRLQDVPLVVEVPNPWPQAIHWRDADWRIGPDRMIAGRAYDVYRGKTQLTVDFGQNQHHVGVFGASGAGKSILLDMLLLSLAANNSPAELRFLLCDLKGQDLPVFRDLPHVEAVATTVKDAERLIAYAYNIAKERTNQTAHKPRYVVVVDEQAELRNADSALDMQTSIMSMGRGLGVDMIVSTQDPTKEALGGKFSTRNLSVKLVGNVESADAARYATGRPGSGAQYLPRGGAFLYIDGPTMQRFQAYLIPKDEITDTVGHISQKWRYRSVTSHNRSQMAHHQSSPVTPVTADNRSNGTTSAPTAITGDDNRSIFPIGEGRALTASEKSAVRKLAESGKFDWRGKLSQSALAMHVYGSKNKERMDWIKEAIPDLLTDEQSPKIIRLPWRARA
jgi:hypothetical protein